MLKHLYSSHILRDPVATVDNASGGATQISAPAATIPSSNKGTDPSPKAAPKEELDKEFRIEDFDVEQLPPQQDKTTTAATKKEEKKEEVKTTTASVKEEKKEEKKTATIPKGMIQIPSAGGKETKAVERDLSGYSSEEQTFLKQMSNPAFEWASKIAKENKELSKLKDSTYLQHERAYLLSPEFSEKQNELRYTRQEAQYWQSQLVAMRAGKTWKPIEGFDKNGQMILGGEQQPTVESEEMVRSAMNNCVSIASNLEGELRAFPAKYKSQMDSDLKGIDSTCKEMFSWEADPKLLEHKLNIEGLGERTIKQVREDFAEMLPIYMRSHPLVRVCGNLMAALRIGQQFLAEAQLNGQVQQIKKDEAAKVEPSSTDKPAKKETGKEVHGVTEFKIEDDL